MNDADLKKLYSNTGHLIDAVLCASEVRVTALRVNGQYLHGSKGGVSVTKRSERDYIRIDELEIAFEGDYKTTKPHSVTVDCCPDTNILPYLKNFSYEIVRQIIDDELLKHNNKVDAERVACIESCLGKLLKRIRD
jgi:hypothetical protein